MELFKKAPCPRALSVSACSERIVVSWAAKVGVDHAIVPWMSVVVKSKFKPARWVGGADICTSSIKWHSKEMMRISCLSEYCRTLVQIGAPRVRMKLLSLRKLVASHLRDLPIGPSIERIRGSIVLRGLWLKCSPSIRR